MRLGVAIVLAGVALAGAVYFASLRLERGQYLCGGPFGVGVVPCSGHVGQSTPREYADRRAVWQIPVAIVIAAVGLGAAVAVARGGT